MARAANLSKHHFLRAFKQVFHSTPHQHLTSKRLMLAKTLLSETELSITQICLSVGFENVSAFSRLVRKHFRVSPNQFRSKQAN
jgi:AraC-like DNA-binding protein